MYMYVCIHVYIHQIDGGEYGATYGPETWELNNRDSKKFACRGNTHLSSELFSICIKIRQR